MPDLHGWQLRDRTGIVRAPIMAAVKQTVQPKQYSTVRDHRWRFVAYLMIGWVLAFVVALYFAHNIIETIGG